MAPSQQLAIPLVSDDELAAIGTLGDVFSTVAREDIQRAQDFGTGFVVLKDKDKLVDTPFAVVKSMFYQSDKYQRDGNASIFVTLFCVTEKGEKWILNDGGVGICDQYRRATERATGQPVVVGDKGAPGIGTPAKPFFAGTGLARSEYDTVIDGRDVHGVTYYIDGM